MLCLLQSWWVLPYPILWCVSRASGWHWGPPGYARPYQLAGVGCALCSLATVTQDNFAPCRYVGRGQNSTRVGNKNNLIVTTEPCALFCTPVSPEPTCIPAPLI